jgi:hypothetical protein
MKSKVKLGKILTYVYIYIFGTNIMNIHIELTKYGLQQVQNFEYKVGIFYLI